jgi:hypothetical protein
VEYNLPTTQQVENQTGRIVYSQTFWRSGQTEEKTKQGKLVLSVVVSTIIKNK